ncbi:Molybdopterin-synthase sulfurtransferase [Myriangium duriaei CBS 260.36]|uniref:Adenylyltransferase and sulfurtransferase uba4 n=1 Tax=Myriangium duriaei CBS 260.36 TaxID=1168546 RepID=A0A9P4JF23_9PEZI|nr:Molybdopterin-synthase sulfurtransferase [Myriangium duriaei CBS 260.36]
MSWLFLRLHTPKVSLDPVRAYISQIKSQIRSTEQHLSSLNHELREAHRRAAAARELDEAYRGGMPHEWQRETLSALEQFYAASTPTALATPSITSTFASTPAPSASEGKQWPLSADEYKRYGRQLIMPEVGLEGQLRLKSARVLIVGAGGLGCPAAAYLAGAGVGTLGLIDGDTVEASNLHRQIAHSTSRVGQTKVSSAIAFLRDLNPHVKYVAHDTHLVPQTALSVMQHYDLVLDCTDHPTSRYLISDACVLARKPLVSASALRTEGQLIVLNYPPRPPGDTAGGPCYRCVFPVPPPPESLTSCSEGGILGPVVGTMGVLQALEAIKLLTSPTPSESPQPTLLLFAPYSASSFRTIRMRPRRPACVACGSAPSITPNSLTSGATDYVAFCGTTTMPRLPDAQRIAATQLASVLDVDSQVAVLDVRPAVEHAICSLDGSINVPFTELGSVLKRATGDVSQSDQPQQQRPPWLDAQDLVVVCRLGNDSQLAVKAISDAGLTHGRVVDMRDGFRGWRELVDPSWPDY